MSCKESLPVLPDYIAYYLFAKIESGLPTSADLQLFVQKAIYSYFKPCLDDENTKATNQALRLGSVSVFFFFNDDLNRGSPQHVVFAAQMYPEGLDVCVEEEPIPSA